MSRGRLAALLALGSAFALDATPALAHGRSVSYSNWELSPRGARVRLRIAELELTRLAPEALARARPGEAVFSYFSDRLELVAGERPCRPVAPPTRGAATPGWGVFTWSLRCASDAPRAIRSSLLLEVAPSHLHFARLRLGDGTVVERVLSEAEPGWELPDARATASSRGVRGSAALDYLRLGIHHILSGFDHLAFVLVLLLLAGTLGEVASLVTAFTVAHSVTLGLAVLGVVRPEAGAVEALIGFSIALVAAENSWLLGGRDRVIPAVTVAALLALALLASTGVGLLEPLTVAGLSLFALCHFELLRRARRPAMLRAAVAFAFGLVHGFGFAGVLNEMELPSGRLASALFGFNVGVELGQLAVVVAIWPVLRLLAGFAAGRWHRALAEAGSAAICGLGLFWFVTRALG